MGKMTEISSVSQQFYQTPSENVLQSRKVFYLSYKVKKEPVLEWLRRLKTCIDGCDFGPFADFLLIDKFICELDTNELNELNFIGALSLDRLLEVLENQTIYIENNPNDVEAFTAPGNDLNEILGIKIDIVSDLFSI